MAQLFDDGFFSEQEKLFYMTGFSMRSKSRNFQAWLKTFVSMLVVCITPVQLLLEAVFSEGLIYSTESLVTAIIIFNSATKIISIFIKEDLIISTYRLVNDRVVKEKSVKWKNAILTESRQQVEKIQKFFLVNFGVCVFAALLNSAITRYFNPEGGLPLRQWFPFDTSTSTGFIAGFCYQIFTTLYGVIIFTFNYMTFCGLVLHTSALMKILEIDLVNLVKDCKVDDIQVDLKDKMRNIIDSHMTIMRLVKSINEVFGNIKIGEGE
ncbi:uncharacterized protein LOC106673979 [Cimex lectularius]|uniref:Odorant receptor n=1 Tax=Cimex lectularius TaxID=79782 RepID=A0A8I6SCJ0_CIMLE|nr:uncharacterized protein LOC106673979 [Cimex lectularius]